MSPVVWWYWLRLGIFRVRGEGYDELYGSYFYMLPFIDSCQGHCHITNIL